MSDGLAPCPFCGEAAHVHENDWCEPSEWSVQCTSCMFHLSAEDYSRDGAIKAWNRRVPPPLPPDVAGLVRRLREIDIQSRKCYEFRTGRNPGRSLEGQAADTLESLYSTLAEADALEEFGGEFSDEARRYFGSFKAMCEAKIRAQERHAARQEKREC